MSSRLSHHGYAAFGWKRDEGSAYDCQYPTCHWPFSCQDPFSCQENDWSRPPESSGSSERKEISKESKPSSPLAERPLVYFGTWLGYIYDLTVSREDRSREDARYLALLSGCESWAVDYHEISHASSFCCPGGLGRG